jgi:threonyl-tRNA synthetase
MAESEMKITFPNGDVHEFVRGITCLEVAKSISEGLARAAVAAKLDGVVVDLTRKIESDAKFEVIKFESKEGKDVFWHSSSHVMAKAILRLFPDAKLTIGPAIETGFYYDIDIGTPFTPEDLVKIEAEMGKIVKENEPFQRSEVSRSEAEKIINERLANPYKIELLKDVPEGEKISFYSLGKNFIDLCYGPHLPSSGKIKAFKLLNTSTAYWRGDAKNKALQRVYGVSFPEKKELDAHLKMLEDAAKRDHRKIGKDLGIFTFAEEVGMGLPLWLPKGEVLRHLLVEYMRKMEEEDGYVYVHSPSITRADLYYATGHLPYYKDSMYAPIEIDGMEYYLKPMNCPHHHMMFRTLAASYKDLPVRFAEAGDCFRHELSGTMHGLMRVRCFTQNDSHMYVTPAQLKKEVIGVARLFQRVYVDMGISDYSFRLSLPDFENNPGKYGGEEKKWADASEELRQALLELKVPFDEVKGEASFYGPKIDIQLKNVYGQEDTIATIQIDIMIPKRLNLTFVNEKGEKENVIIIHRAILGSYERFIAYLLEHYAGNLPFWLSPVQAIVLPIADRHTEGALKVVAALHSAGIRTEIDSSNQTLDYRIRNAQLAKIPYMLVVGDRELENNSVTARKRTGEVMKPMALDEFLEFARKKNDGKELEL